VLALLLIALVVFEVTANLPQEKSRHQEELPKF